MVSVFRAIPTYPYYEMVQVDYEWHNDSVMNAKSVIANYNSAYYDDRVLLLDSISDDLLGRKLSSGSLLCHKETVYSSVRDTFLLSPRVKDRAYRVPKEYGVEERMLLEGGTDRLIDHYDVQFEGVNIPTPDFHISLAYDIVYCRVLFEKENSDILNELLNCNRNAFVEMTSFGGNCAARAVAIVKGMHYAGILKGNETVSELLNMWRVDLNDPDYMQGVGSVENSPMYDVNYGFTRVKKLPIRVSADNVEEVYENFRRKL